jgi:hypothetical protein
MEAPGISAGEEIETPATDALDRGAAEAGAGEEIETPATDALDPGAEEADAGEAEAGAAQDDEEKD